MRIISAPLSAQRLDRKSTRLRNPPEATAELRQAPAEKSGSLDSRLVFPVWNRLQCCIR